MNHSLVQLIIPAIISVGASLASCETADSRMKDRVVITTADSTLAQDSLSPVPPASTGGNNSRGASADKQGKDSNAVAAATEPASSFFKEAAGGHQEEIRLSALAERKGTTAEIKNLARQFRTDHESLLSELQQLRNSSALPVSGKKESDLDSLKEKSFEEAWKKTMLQHMESLTSLYNRQRTQSNNQELQVHLERALVKLNANLQKMKQVISK